MWHAYGFEDEDVFEADCVSFGLSMPPVNGTVTVVPPGEVNCVFVAVKVVGTAVVRELDVEVLLADVEVVEEVVDVEVDEEEVVDVVEAEDVVDVVDAEVDVEITDDVDVVVEVLEAALVEDEDVGPLIGGKGKGKGKVEGSGGSDTCGGMGLAMTAGESNEI